MRTNPQAVGDVLLDALAERIAERIGERIDMHFEHFGRPVEKVSVSVVEAAESLGVSVRTVERLIEAGELTSVTIGARRLVPMVAVRRLGTHGVVADSEAAS